MVGRKLKNIAFYSLLFLISIYFEVSGQAPPIPVSPGAAALAKSVNYSVSMNTGVPEISLPLYTIEREGFTLPIALSYHAGGFKINERATSVGLGWSLTCELQITRSINGLDDFHQSGYIHNVAMKAGDCGPSCDYPLDILIPNSYSYNYTLASGETDGAPDKFNYKLLNKSGSFYFQKTENGSGYTIVPVPYDNIKITFNNNLFTIVDTDGTTYYFGTDQNNNDTSPEIQVEQRKELTGGMSAAIGACIDCKITAWKCKKITNPTNTGEITFDYQIRDKESFTTNSDQIAYYNNSSPCNLPAYWRPKDITGYNPTITTYEHLLQTIPFYALSSPKYKVSTQGRMELHMPDLDAQGNQVKKIYTSNASDNTSGYDVRGLALKHITFPGGTIDFEETRNKLRKITIRNSGNQEVRSFSFYQSYKTAVSDTSRKTLYLDSIQMRAGLNVFERYYLTYRNKFCFGDHLVGQDAWGYTNANTRELNGQPTSNTVPSQVIKQRFWLSGCVQSTSDVTFIVGNNDPLAEVPTKSAVTQNGMLQCIIYPTGGRVGFDFEPNLYEEPTQAQDGTGVHQMLRVGGGVRIRSINYYDAGPDAYRAVMQKYYTYGEFENGAGMLINRPARKYVDARFEYEGYRYEQAVGYVTGPNSVPGAPGTPFYPIPNNCHDKSCLTLRHTDTKTTYLPASAMDYTHSNGAPIYYTRVTEYQSDLGRRTGKKVYTYYHPNTFVRTQDQYAPRTMPGTNVRYLQGDGLIGHLSMVEDFKFKNDRFVPVHTKQFNYRKYSTTLQPRVAYSFFRTVYEFVGGNFSGNVDGITMYETSPFGGGASIYINQPNFLYGQYGIDVARILVAQESDIWIDDNGTQTTKTVAYNYDKLPYLNPTSIVTSDSKNESRITYFKHPYDFPGDAVYGSMVTANMIAPIVETQAVNTTRGAEISRAKTNYGLVHEGFGFYAPVSVETSSYGGPLQLEIAYSRYDKKAHVLETRSHDGITRAYLWGYNYQYPVAEFVNGIYATLENLTNVEALHAITDEQQLRTTLASLRSSMKPANGKIFTYLPLVGVASMTDYNEQQTSYEYDAYGRLLRIKNMHGDIVKHFTYNSYIQKSSTLFNTSTSVNTPTLASLSPTCSSSQTHFKPINRVFEGGQVAGMNVDVANDNASNYGTGSETTSDDGTCKPISELSKITLNTYLFSNLPGPSLVFVDFIQDKSIVGCQRFPHTNQPGPMFYFLPGTYTLSFRNNSDFNNAILEYWVSGSDGTGTWRKSGEALILKPGVSYEISMRNSL
jgi:YD repeat-containing protein